MFVSFRKYYFAYSKKLETANVREKVVLNCTVIYAIERGFCFDYFWRLLLQMPTHELRIAATYLTLYFMFMSTESRYFKIMKTYKVSKH